ncbi:MAG: hypothetical protein R3C97_16190 [Geminicoccaceae bacterium]
MNLFSDHDKTGSYPGLTQFILLLTLYPFMLDPAFFGLSLEMPAPTVFELQFRYPDDDSWNFNFNIDPFAGLFEGLAFAVSMVLLVVGIVPALRRRQWGWATFALAIPWAMLAIVVVRYALDLRSFRFGDNDYLALNLASKTAFVWLVFRGQLLSRSFLIFVLLVLLPTIFMVPGGWGIFEAARAVLPIIALMLAVAVVRLVILAIFENAGPLRRMGLRRGLSVFARTAIVWAPILLFSLPYFIGTAIFEDAMIEKAYGPCPVQRGRAAPNCPEAMGAEHLAIHGEERELRTDSLYTISRFFQKEVDRWMKESTDLENYVRTYPVAQLSDEFRQAVRCGHQRAGRFQHRALQGLSFRREEFRGRYLAGYLQCRLFAHSRSRKGITRRQGGRDGKHDRRRKGPGR